MTEDNGGGGTGRYDGVGDGALLQAYQSLESAHSKVEHAARMLGGPAGLDGHRDGLASERSLVAKECAERGLLPDDEEQTAANSWLDTTGGGA